MYLLIFVIVLIVILYTYYNGNYKNKKIKDGKSLKEFQADSLRDALVFIKESGNKFYSKKKNDNTYLIIDGDLTYDKLEDDSEWDTFNLSS